MAEFYSARGWEIPPLPWTNLSPPFSYDERAAEYAPGRLLLYKLIESCFEQDVIASIEFYTRVTTDQLSWANGQREISHFNIFPCAVLGKCMKLARRVKKAITAPRSNYRLTTD